MEQELLDIKGVFDTYVFGALLCARAVAPVVVRQKSGVMAVTSSIAATEAISSCCTLRVKGSCF